ncbi:hypothetical protein EAG_13046 [Camponotus floridanus]|uniref:Chitin-binding type-4 domain-containing protein n=2 Tax=Camponotus floridanus TaxID=104421 RepID=E2A7W4_CAMFO|nr:hypothetical protein EAG_13046 [Camponotus floridanus]
MGYFEFSVCPLKTEKELETDECFDQHYLLLADGSGHKFPINGAKDYVVRLILPKDVTCKHCVLRWNYRTGNTWGTCEDGKQGMGCGPQETFRSCADVSIVN